MTISDQTYKIDKSRTRNSLLYQYVTVNAVLKCHLFVQIKNGTQLQYKLCSKLERFFTNGRFTFASIEILWNSKPLPNDITDTVFLLPVSINFNQLFPLHDEYKSLLISGQELCHIEDNADK